MYGLNVGVSGERGVGEISGRRRRELSGTGWRDLT